MTVSPSSFESFLRSALSNPKEALLQLDRVEAAKSLARYIKLAWPVLEPATPYVHGWHIDAISEHLEAVTAGEITRLIVCVPPGFMKSLTTGVFWPTWEWGPKGLPAHRYVSTAHREPLAVRDNLKARRLVQSVWYQQRWGAAAPGTDDPLTDKRVIITGDQNAKTKFENTKTGFREGMPFTAMTGSRGSRVLIDDPMSVDDARSPAKREAIVEIFLEAIPTRLNDQQTDAIVIIQQRLHALDVVGTAIAKNLGYETLVLPMEMDRDPVTSANPNPPLARCRTKIGFVDPRTEEGELLFPEKFPKEVVEKLKNTLGSYAVAGQLQQRPVPREGAMFKREWFDVVQSAPAGTRWVRHFDLAATRGGAGARTAGVKLGITPDGKLIVGHVVTTRQEGVEVKRLIKQTFQADKKQHGNLVTFSLPQDPGQAGKVQKMDFLKLLHGLPVAIRPETGDKVTRAEPLAAQAEGGNMALLSGPWNEAFLDEVQTFPGGALKDQVDAMSGAYGSLLKQHAMRTTAGPRLIRRTA
jgi:predicted phage terminase large subunit-like protein